MTSLDFSQPPFDVLSPVERQSLKKHTQVRYLAQGESLNTEDYAFFYVVLKGRVQQYLADDFVGEFAASTFSNDWFDARRQVSDSDAYTLRAAHHTISAPASVTANALQNHPTPIPSEFVPASESIANAEAAATSVAHYNYSAVEDSLLLQITGAAWIACLHKTTIFASCYPANLASAYKRCIAASTWAYPLARRSIPPKFRLALMRA